MKAVLPQLDHSVRLETLRYNIVNYLQENYNHCRCSVSKQQLTETEEDLRAKGG